MTRWFVTPLLLSLTLALSGCIIHNLERECGVVGELFREDFLHNGCLPGDIVSMAKKRRVAYKRLNEVDYGRLYQDECFHQGMLDEIMRIRFELMRLNHQGDYLITELKDLYAYDPCADSVAQGFEEMDPMKRAETIMETERDVRMVHQVYMEKHAWLMRLTRHHRPFLLNRVFFMTQNRV